MILEYIPDSGLSLLPLGVRVCRQWQVKHQRCSRSGWVQKNHNILRKNTIFNEHPVKQKWDIFSKILKYIPDSGLSRFLLGVSVYTQWQVKHQRCSRTGRVQKNYNMNTLYIVNFHYILSIADRSPWNLHNHLYFLRVLKSLNLKESSSVKGNKCTVEQSFDQMGGG